MRSIRALFYSLPLWLELLLLTAPTILIATGAILWDIHEVRARLLTAYPEVDSVVWNPLAYDCRGDWLRDRGAFPFTARTQDGKTVRGYVCWSGFAPSSIHVT